MHVLCRKHFWSQRSSCVEDRVTEPTTDTITYRTNAPRRGAARAAGSPLLSIVIFIPKRGRSAVLEDSVAAAAAAAGGHLLLGQARSAAAARGRRPWTRGPSVRPLIFISPLRRLARLLVVLPQPESACDATRRARCIVHEIFLAHNAMIHSHSHDFCFTFMSFMTYLETCSVLLNLNQQK